jgi:Cu/Ag efflux pump CusA
LRYGASTKKDGKAEIVLRVSAMLKGRKPSAVVDGVKKKWNEINKTPSENWLPEAL